MENIAIIFIVIVLVVFITSLFKKLSKNMKDVQESKETNKEDVEKSKETKLWKKLNTEFTNIQSENTEDILKILKRQNIHLSRISKNVQFFFWVFIVSLALSIGFSIFGL